MVIGTFRQFCWMNAYKAQNLVGHCPVENNLSITPRVPKAPFSVEVNKDLPSPGLPTA